jgi:hypothetical protein
MKAMLKKETKIEQAIRMTKARANVKNGQHTRQSSEIGIAK